MTDSTSKHSMILQYFDSGCIWFHWKRPIKPEKWVVSTDKAVDQQEGLKVNVGASFTNISLIYKPIHHCLPTAVS